jgi:hypothetical protein
VLLLISEQHHQLTVFQIIKFENAYLEFILKQKDYAKLMEMLPKFICKLALIH